VRGPSHAGGSGFQECKQEGQRSGRPREHRPHHGFQHEVVRHVRRGQGVNRAHPVKCSTYARGRGLPPAGHSPSRVQGTREEGRQARRVARNKHEGLLHISQRPPRRMHSHGLGPPLGRLTPLSVEGVVGRHSAAGLGAHASL